MIILTSFVLSKSNLRNKEILFALNKNSENPLIDSIHIFTEDCNVRTFVKDISKAYVHETCDRPTFKTLVDYSNNLTDTVAITNSDIFFDHTLSKPLLGVAYCLTRWFPNIGADGNGPWDCCPWFEQDGMSFDTYIFNPPISPQNIDFHMGVLGCDNRFAYQLWHSGLRVCNPSIMIRSYHVHDSNIREYKEEDRLLGDYLFIDISLNSCGFVRYLNKDHI